MHGNCVFLGLAKTCQERQGKEAPQEKKRASSISTVYRMIHHVSCSGGAPISLPTNVGGEWVSATMGACQFRTFLGELTFDEGTPVVLADAASEV